MSTDPDLPPLRLAVPAVRSHAEAELTASTVLRLVAAGAATDRAALVRATGLARTTVVARVDELLAAGLLVERGLRPSGGRGRPARVTTVRGAAAVALVIDVGMHGARLLAADLAQRVVARQRIALDPLADPEHVVGELGRRAGAMLAEAGVDGSAVDVCVVGLPGPVDRARGALVRPPVLPHWDGYPVADVLRSRLGWPVLVENDANLNALGEARALPPEASPLLFVKIGTGIGAGLVLSDGRLHRGQDGAAGGIGHLRVPEAADVPCRCGGNGCLEAVASTLAVIEGLRRDGVEGIESGEDLGARLRVGDEHVVRRVRTSAATVGGVVAMLVDVLNPARVVVGGAVATATDDVLAGIRSAIYRDARPLATRSLDLVPAALGQTAALAGGLVLGIEHLLSPEGTARLLARSGPVPPASRRTGTSAGRA